MGFSQLVSHGRTILITSFVGGPQIVNVPAYIT